MQHLQPIDRLLFWTLVPIWVAFACMHVVTVVRAGSTISLPAVETGPVSSPDGYPRVVRVWGEPAEDGLRVGDRLIRIGSTDMRGSTQWGEFIAYWTELQPSGQSVQVFERSADGAELEYPIHFERNWYVFALTLGFAGTAIILLLRARPSRLLRNYFAAAMAYAIYWALSTASLPSFAPLQPWAQMAASMLAWPLFLRAALLLPEEGSERRRLGLWIWIFAMPGALRAVDGLTILPRPIQEVIHGLLAAFGIAFALAMLTALTRGYLRADAIGRRQHKWVVLGAYIAVIPAALATAWAIGEDRVVLDLVPFWVELFFIAVPISFLIAMTRYNLLDIDRILSATATLSILGFAALATALILVPPAAAALSQALSFDPATGQTALSIALAAAVILAARYARPILDRVLFAERYAIDHGMGELSGEIDEGGAPEELLRLLGERLDRVIRPESCAIYGPAGDVFAPLFARGRTLTPAFAVPGGFVSALTRRRRALDLPAWLAGPGSAIDDMERAELEAVSLAVPIRSGPELLAFVCLGPKRSGDVYTQTDRALLDTVAVQIGAEFQRFDQAELLRAREAMMGQLRLYVPGAIATQLEAGEGLEPEEREVSVLFVDLRGYTSFSEGLTAREIFHTVNRYTETISEIVHRHGGSVVEFNGDGMMVVFGAPRALADKEGAAVTAGREMVRALSGRLPDGEAAPLAAGVGIATGCAFVGNIRSVDRFIWSAVGNTTNLAARLQTLTRELDADVVIDAATFTAAKPLTVDFVPHPGTRVRGRREPVDVYALTLAH